VESTVEATPDVWTTLPTARGEVGRVTPAGGWAVLPEDDELVELAAALNVVGQPPVFLDRLTA
jgi:hypothetical protein